MIVSGYSKSRTINTAAKMFNRSKNKFSFLFLILFLLINTCANAQYDKMIIGDNNNSQIVMANIDGSNIDTVNLGGLNQSFYDSDVDPVHKKIYMAWYYGIYSMNYDGSGFDTIVYYPAGNYSDGIAVDPINGHIYWGSIPDDKIYRADLDGTNQITILSGLSYVGDVDIDLIHGYLFYGQHIVAGKGLFRVNLNGTNDTTIASGYSVQYLGLDIKNQIIYFGDGSKVRKISYEGFNDTLLFNFQPGGFFVDTTNSFVYYANMTNNHIVRTNLMGANSVDIISTQLYSPHGIVLIEACSPITAQPTNQSVIVNSTAQFTIQVLDNSVNYQWQTDTGSGYQDITNTGQYSGATNDTLTVSNTTLANNNQPFRCKVTNLICFDTSVIATLYVNSSGIIDAEATDQFKVYPNPATSTLNVVVNAGNIGSAFYIIDQLGRTVITGKLNDLNSNIEIGDLSVGVYLLRIADNSTHTYTFVKN